MIDKKNVSNRWKNRTAFTNKNEYKKSNDSTRYILDLNCIVKAKIKN
jgi:hypothetical protein